MNRELLQIPDSEHYYWLVNRRVSLPSYSLAETHDRNLLAARVDYGDKIHGGLVAINM